MLLGITLTSPLLMDFSGILSIPLSLIADKILLDYVPPTLAIVGIGIIAIGTNYGCQLNLNCLLCLGYVLFNISVYILHQRAKREAQDRHYESAQSFAEDAAAEPLYKPLDDVSADVQ